MKPFRLCYALGISALIISGCSTGSQKPVQISSNGPTIVNARTEPGVVILNRDLQPNQPAEVLADIKDFKYNIVDVRLKFRDVPLEVPLENIGGTTWKAQLSPQELQMLAVSGKTIKYQADIIAQNSTGDTGKTQDPLTIAVRAPDLSAHYG
jgi:hypothetical protein